MGKKKVLIITYIVPYPADAGGKISIFGTINYLRFHFDITLVVRASNKQDKENVEILRSLWPEVTIETADYYKGKNTMHLMLLPFYKLANTMMDTLKNAIVRHAVNVEHNKIDIFPFSPADTVFINLLQKLFSNNQYDIIQVEYTTLLNLVHVLPDNSIKVFVQIENRYTILKDYFFKVRDESLYARYIVENARFYELALMDKYDYIVALNKNDKENLGHYLDKEKIAVAPFPILDSLTNNDPHVSFSKGQLNKLIFLGPQGHVPNEDAVRWFIEEMYEKIYAKYKLKFYVTGKWKKEFVKKYPNVIFTGHVDSLYDLIRNSIVISPIRLGGGGVRAKVLQAMAMKVPIISTSLGSEGLEDLKNNENIYIADSKMEFINAVEDIIENEEKTNQVINNAFDLIQKNYSEKSIGIIRKNMYNKFIEDHIKSKEIK